MCSRNWPDSHFRRRRTYPSTYRDLDSPHDEETPAASNQQSAYPQRAPLDLNSASGGRFVNAQAEEDTWVIKPTRNEGANDGVRDLKRGNSDETVRDERGELARRAGGGYGQNAPFRGGPPYGSREDAGYGRNERRAAFRGGSAFGTRVGDEYGLYGANEKREHEDEGWRRRGGVEDRGGNRIERGLQKKVIVNEPRLFVAILVDDATRLHLCGLPISHIPKRRVADDKGYHLTLSFIGNANYSRVHSALQGVEADAFEVQVKGVGAFPSRKRPLTLWAGVAASRELERLQFMVREALVASGYKLDTRAYVPHITLAWVHNTQVGIEAGVEFLEMNKQFEANRFRVGEFVLMETLRAGSKESGTHGVYVVRERYGLRERGVRYRR